MLVQRGKPLICVDDNKVIARILFLADTHLGFDLPLRPRINRRRRGPDFFANYHTALQPAFKKEIDIVVHGGDLLYRSRVPISLVELALEPLVQIAESGIPVMLIPGNHERGQIPLHLWARHANLYVFNKPGTVTHTIAGRSLSFSGFPYYRNITSVFKERLDQTGYNRIKSDFRFLCIHQAVEGAQVGIMNYTFRSGPEVIRGGEIPHEFTAVLSGHIHRAQMITHGLNRRRMAAAVIYPGSVERTSFIERDEIKKYIILTLDSDGGLDVRFIPLKTRPMVNLVYNVIKQNRETVVGELKKMLNRIDSHAVVRIQIQGSATGQVENFLTTDLLRKIAPSTMNISLSVFKKSQK